MEADQIQDIVGEFVAQMEEIGVAIRVIYTFDSRTGDVTSVRFDFN